ncbi:bacterial group 2 Ig-like protein [Tannerella forsythia KS16]|uniref:BACON domain-containing protein n=1 Tax=Tannerella forsythia TaxID=28112 RepID=UPI000618C19F|nr:BACON domain-containing carbohydrate-binding protein [Tannerella forsythia]BAR51939.1 surface antigen BspA [Tannerella forsythia KS16]BAR51941.1 bacterial group 2 Ig-like protein [Tannerella forsythia KS16]
MKQVKHFSIWIITLFLGLMGSTVSAWAQQYDFTQGGLYYKIHGSDVHIVSENATSPYNTLGGGNFTIQKTVTYGGNTYNVTKIGAHAFEDRNILSINILADITEIGESAFIGNYLLWSCYLRGNGLTSIGEKAFYSCQSLRSLDIPESVTSIGEKAFGKCFALKPRVHWMNSGSIPPIQENVFEDIGISPEYSVLYVPENTMLEYLNRNVWSKFLIVEDVLLSFRPNVVVVEAAGGTIESGITSGFYYRLSTTDSWITNPYFGSPENGSQVFSAKVAPNTGPLRSGKVTATMLSGEVYTLTIVQKGTGGGASSLSATPLITATHAAETGKTVTVTASGVWTTATTESWITGLPTSPTTGNGTFTFNMAANPGSAHRIGEITVTDGTLTQKVIVVQDGAGGPSLSATPLITATNAAEAGKTVTVKATGSWTTATTESWITGLPTSATTGNGTFTFDVAANSGSAHRIGEITLTDGTLTQKVFVVQDGAGGPSLSATPLITATNAAETGKTVTVTATGSWTTATTESWITGLPTSATTGNGTFTFNVKANPGDYRIGEITLTDGTLTQKVFVVQDGTVSTPPPTVIEKIVEKIVEKEVPPREVMVSSVKLNKPSLMLENVKTAQLNATITPANATNPFLYWQSSDPFIASVDGSGLVTIHKKGKATITVKATDGSGKSASCEVEVLSAVANETIDGLRIYAAAGALHLTLPSPATAHIYNVNGAMVKMLALPAGDHVQPLAPGVYVVRVGERVTKVMVK